ncbi:MAG: hypothetical protein EOR30_25925 [Mesorhizobium sp.]|uniref:hypothetical protein n=1 Tax=Mesorhizobium sp. TaxID=1871066 RepID=UPI000FE6A83E|nr:hypothetical protein [Mesorhizobium sp.]RWI37038.1 MAG: hypothetical protein EOR14_25835 [Mesorhizobium sp.]RWI63247.1 MAG: hypothetical protein EOR17_29205 [Mesorhizobium sp.]RWI82522.1 MAG: hypothetical protein EOR20_26860 [Mesorhizobium sp.]RWJ46698.1 MAG: hypothetical protein EOR30_25925 [Mesorhizobium sp.]RWJ57531.1 MAG: hypothetical protein EOR32_29595 [Mesorhizobium sp.]
MSANNIYDNAPLGSLINYGDHAPRPPARFTKRLAASEGRNGVGRLVRKTPPREHETWSSPAAITLHEGDFSSGSVILVTVRRTHSVDSDLIFKIIERPAIGMVRVLRVFDGNIELLHLADNREAAELWLTKSGSSHMVLEEVTADEVGADVVEGRTAA